MATAENIIFMQQPGYLQEQGGSFVATRTWAKSLLTQMNFVKRKSSNAENMLTAEFKLQNGLPK